MPSHFISFPKDFLWGAATSAFQIEGHPLADGAAKSNWYEWTHSPGRIEDNQNADTACDFYHTYKSDIALMKQMGLKTFRFSLSWPRIIPERGRVNEKAIDFYRRLIDELDQAGIYPNATLFHWEVPVWAKGEWENPEIVPAFQEYAETVFKKLGKEVGSWATHNEPTVVSQIGYLQGFFPPGKMDKKAFAKATHHLNVAHGLAVQSYRQLNLGGEIGWVLALSTFRSNTQDPVDLDYTKKMEDLNNGFFLDPSAGRGYSDFFFDYTGESRAYYEKDYQTIAQPIDFLGVNHYNPNYVRYMKGNNLYDNAGFVPPGMPMNDLKWAVDPTALYELLVSLWKNYGHKKLYITENGFPTRDKLRSKEEIIEDDVRVHYLGTYLAQAHKAIQEGVPLKNYFAWSLLDNFEWCFGYDPRFGLIHVDFKTQKRTFKKSAKWYQKTIADNGFDPTLLPKNPPYHVFK